MPPSGYNRAVLASAPPVRAVLVALIAVCCFAAGIWLALPGGGRTAAPREAIPGLLWPDPKVLQDFSLTDEDGRSFDRSRLLGRWSLLFFGFTNCPDVCPTTLAVLKQARQQLADAPPAQVVFVSVDPERDDRETLKRYVDYFDPAIVGVTGEPAELETLTRQLGILYMKAGGDGPDEAYTVDHTASILLLDPAARLVGIMSPPHDAAQVSELVTRIQNFIQQDS